MVHHSQAHQLNLIEEHNLRPLRPLDPLDPLHDPTLQSGITRFM